MNTKNLQKNALYFGVVLVTLVISYQYFHQVQTKYLSVTTFKECVDAGFEVTATYPEKCIAYGKSFSNPLQKKIQNNNKETTFTQNKDYKNQSYIIDGQQVSFYEGAGILPSNYVLRQATTSLRLIDKPFLYDINDDGIQDTVFLIKTEDTRATNESYYVASTISLREGFYGSNALFLDFNLIDAAFIYRNGEIVVGYTTKQASTTLKQKYYIFEGDILKQLSHK